MPRRRRCRRAAPTRWIVAARELVEEEERAANPVVAAMGGDRDLARAVWAFAHGMTILELNERFPPGADLDTAWQRGLDSFRPEPG